MKDQIIARLIDYLEIGGTIVLLCVIAVGVFSLIANLIFAIKIRRLDAKIQQSLKERHFGENQ